MKYILPVVALSLCLACAEQTATHGGHDGMEDSAVSSAGTSEASPVDDVIYERQKEMRQKMMQQNRPNYMGAPGGLMRR